MHELAKLQDLSGIHLAEVMRADAEPLIRRKDVIKGRREVLLNPSIPHEKATLRTAALQRLANIRRAARGEKDGRLRGYETPEERATRSLRFLNILLRDQRLRVVGPSLLGELTELLSMMGFERDRDGAVAEPAWVV
jgi:hypothetical protein